MGGRALDNSLTDSNQVTAGYEIPLRTYVVLGDCEYCQGMIIVKLSEKGMEDWLSLSGL